MNLKKTVLLLVAISLSASLWLRWWLQPERQIPRAQARLLSAFERRDFDAASRLLAADYRDRWQHDRAFVLQHSREVSVQFATLKIARVQTALHEDSTTWRLEEKLTIHGIGGPLAMVARDAVNALHGPFTMTWRRSGNPWDWELIAVAQPELDLPE